MDAVHTYVTFKTVMEILNKIEIVKIKTMYPVFISVVSSAVCLISLNKLFSALYTKTRPQFFILLL